MMLTEHRHNSVGRLTLSGRPQVTGKRIYVTRPDDAAAIVACPVLLTVPHVARMLDCSARTVRRRIAEHALPAVNEHGRTMVRGDDLRSYIDGLERIGCSGGRRRRGNGQYDFLR